MDNGHVTTNHTDVNDSNPLKYYNKQSYNISKHENDEMHAYIHDQSSYCLH